MRRPNINPQHLHENKKYKFSQTWLKLLGFCKPYIAIIILALICSIGGAVFSILGPDKLGEMTKIIQEGLFFGIDMSALKLVAFTLVAFYGASIILSYLQSFIMATVTQRVSKKLRSDIAKKINNLPLRYFDSTTTGDILSRVTNDVDTIAQTLNQSIGNLVSAITLFVGSIVMMFITNWIMALVAIGASLIGFVFMSLIVARSQKYFIRQQVLLGEMNGHIEEVYSGHNVVKAYNAENQQLEMFRDINKKLYKNSWISQFMSRLMMPLMHFIGNFGYVAVCVVGAVLTMKGVIGFDVIVSFMVYVHLFTQPLSTFAQSVSGLQQTAAANFRVFEILDEKELEDESHKSARLENVKGNVEFKNVKFGYNKDKTIISDFSVKVKAGQKVAIVGPTGAGKTTMVNLLMRFYEVDQGEILIEGVPTSETTRENVHDQFCMVLQDTWLMEGTIKENIAYNDSTITDERIIEVCKSVGLHHFIQTLPKGYDTVLNEETTLSAGQKQLITIARAMVDKAPMLILDEATSNVDTRTEELIQKAMDKLLEGRTSFVIAHRLSTIKNADMILVMKDGNIIEQGRHEELLEKNGFYAELYNSQFDKT